jgi:hypothetical protein
MSVLKMKYVDGHDSSYAFISCKEHVRKPLLETNLIALFTQYRLFRAGQEPPVIIQHSYFVFWRSAIRTSVGRSSGLLSFSSVPPRYGINVKNDHDNSPPREIWGDYLINSAGMLRRIVW